MDKITAKTPWEPWMGEVPMHLDYFQGSMFEAVEKIAERYPENTAFTFSFGAGIDYGGLGFAIRYKPAVGRSSDTFLAARIAYDWWVAPKFALEFHGGFGVGGFGSKGLFDYYDFPFGFGLLFAL